MEEDLASKPYPAVCADMIIRAFSRPRHRECTWQLPCVCVCALRALCVIWALILAAAGCPCCRVALLQEVYELVRGLPYLWVARVLSTWLRKQHAHFPWKRNSRVDTVLTEENGQKMSAHSCPIRCGRPLPALSIFLWEARLAYISQRVLRGPSAAVCPAPSLLRCSVDEYAEALKQISVSLADTSGFGLSLVRGSYSTNSRNPACLQSPFRRVDTQLGC